jgi:cytochrome c oxidase subunit I
VSIVVPPPQHERTSHRASPSSKRSVWIRAGWWRALLWTWTAGGLGVVLPAFIRYLLGWEWYSRPVTFTTVLFLMPIGFIMGIGTCDYWARYMIGSPTRPEDHSDHGAYRWQDYFKVNTDHKVIGVQYVVTTFAFFLVGGLCAEAFRTELAKPGLQFFTGEQYNGLISVHAALMIFLFIIPMFAGLANFVIPLMLGADDMAFPRLNALSFWMLPTAGVMMIASLFWQGFGAGWTAYAPLASDYQTVSQLFFNIGVQFAGFSSIFTAINFLVTILTMRAPGMTLTRMPLLVWANLATSTLVVVATPFIAGSQFMLLFDHVMHTDFFNYHGGGAVLLYQHVFWFYSHPAVYIMMIPGFGIISEVIPVFSRKPIFGYRAVAFSSMAVMLLSFTVWAHHMFVSGMPSWLRIPIMISSLLIAVPTGIKIFSWVSTLWNGVINLATPMLFALGFIFCFVLGGLSGVWLALVPIDVHVTGTYFIVAHIHYVLFGGSVFTIYAGLYFWYPKMTGKMYNETLGKWHFWLTFIFFNATFFPMHYLGTEGMPRRISDYEPKYGDWNMFITICAFGLGASTFLFVYNAIVSWIRGEPAPANPWRALTLEWQVSSPPPVFNFDSQPRIVGGPYNYGQPGARHVVFDPIPTGADSESKPRTH